MRIEFSSDYKSMPKGLIFELPDFCLITGKNGSGKSHLLEAIADLKKTSVSEGDIVFKNIHLIKFGGLSPRVDETCDPREVAEEMREWWQKIKNSQQQLNYSMSNKLVSSLDQHFLSHGSDPQLIQVIKSIMGASKKKFEELTEDDVFFYLRDFDSHGEGVFFSRLATVFKMYHSKWYRNDYQKYSNEKHKTSFPTLSDEQFEDVFGPKPWVLVNEMLQRAELPYEVIGPDSVGLDSSYTLSLRNRANGLEITVNDLSTGEKVLMSLALAIYNTQEGGRRPDLLVLDEPDAPLHPQFSKLLLDVLIESIVKVAKVRVIMTTHSPSTVAMCPNNSLYEIDGCTKTPRMISIPYGLSLLTEGIPHLKVSIEGRRQIFVESKYDVLYYSRLFDVVNRLSPVGFQPIFLEPNSGSSNCTDVIKIVKSLCSGGSDLVRGVVDWDGDRVDDSPIYVLGGGNRYSIENYILDPVFVGIALVRAKKRKFLDYGISGFPAYTTAGLTIGDAQKISDAVLISMGFLLENLKACELMNKEVVFLPDEFLKMRGHDYEKKLISSIPELRALFEGNGDPALKKGVMTVVEEFPQFISKDIFNTFKKLN